MGFVTSGWQAIKWSLYQIGRPGRFVLASSIFHNLNGLFEATTGSPAPGAGAQTVAGHDHSLQGGRPIYRSFVGGFDLGESAGYLISDASAAIVAESMCDKSPSFRVYINPAINDQLSGPPELEAKVFIIAVNDSGASQDFELKLRNVEDGSESDTLSFSVAASTTSSQWRDVTGIPVASGGWQGYDLIASITMTGTPANRSMTATACIVAETANTVAASTGNKYDSATATTRP